MQRPSAFGQLLKRQRESAGLSQERLAELVGVKQSHISKLEGGRIGKPEPPLLDALIAVLDIDREEALAALGWEGLRIISLPELAGGERRDVSLMTHAIDSLGDRFGWSRATRQTILADMMEIHQRERAWKQAMREHEKRS